MTQSEMETLLAQHNMMLNKHSELFTAASGAVKNHEALILQLHDELQGHGIAWHLIIDLIMSADPQIKTYMASALEQILDKPETIPNEYCLALLKNLKDIANNLSPSTPEGRRARMKLVPPLKATEKKQD
jgi:hypothetical protein